MIVTQLRPQRISDNLHYICLRNEKLSNSSFESLYLLYWFELHASISILPIQFDAFVEQQESTATLASLLGCP